MTFIDVFEGLEDLLQKLDNLQMVNLSVKKDIEQQETKLKWSIYGSTVAGIIGTPFTGYSLALTFLGGSLTIPKYKCG